MMHTTRHLTISPSTPTEFEGWGLILGLCLGPYTHTIHCHRHGHIVEGPPISRKNLWAKRLRKHWRVSKQSGQRSCQPSRLRRQLSRHVLDRLSHCLPHRHVTEILHLLWDRLLLVVQVIINDFLKILKFFTTMMFIYITYVTQCLKLDMNISYIFLTYCFF
jgi:hypothetical protein